VQQATTTPYMKQVLGTILVVQNLLLFFFPALSRLSQNLQVLGASGRGDLDSKQIVKRVQQAVRSLMEKTFKCLIAPPPPAESEATGRQADRWMKSLVPASERVSGGLVFVTPVEEPTILSEKSLAGEALPVPVLQSSTVWGELADGFSPVMSLRDMTDGAVPESAGGVSGARDTGGGRWPMPITAHEARGPSGAAQMPSVNIAAEPEALAGLSWAAMPGRDPDARPSAAAAPADSGDLTGPAGLAALAAVLEIPAPVRAREDGGATSFLLAEPAQPLRALEAPGPVLTRLDYHDHPVRALAAPPGPPPGRSDEQVQLAGAPQAQLPMPYRMEEEQPRSVRALRVEDWAEPAGSLDAPWPMPSLLDSDQGQLPPVAQEAALDPGGPPSAHSAPVAPPKAEPESLSKRVGQQMAARYRTPDPVPDPPDWSYGAGVELRRPPAEPAAAARSPGESLSRVLDETAGLVTEGMWEVADHRRRGSGEARGSGYM
jgi:hypothetical protein